jgi:organic hydroperoxide reductase OsmC/OhrA
MPEPKIKLEHFVYRNSLKWLGQRRGLLSSGGKPDIEIATPLEFKGHPGIWTPEDLFVASLNTCIMTTFLHFADKQGLEFLRYESDAVGILEKVENKFMISMIEIKPKISVKQDADIQGVEKLIELCERNCVISNSIKSKVKVTPEIKIGV